MFEEKITFDRFVRFLLGLAGFVLIIYAIHYLSGVLIPSLWRGWWPICFTLLCAFFSIAVGYVVAWRPLL